MTREGDKTERVMRSDWLPRIVLALLPIFSTKPSTNYTKKSNRSPSSMVPTWTERIDLDCLEKERRNCWYLILYCNGTGLLVKDVERVAAYSGHGLDAYSGIEIHGCEGRNVGAHILVPSIAFLFVVFIGNANPGILPTLSD